MRSAGLVGLAFGRDKAFSVRPNPPAVAKGICFLKQMLRYFCAGMVNRNFTGKDLECS